MATFAGARQLSTASLDRLQQHSLFHFQIQDAQVRARVEELQEILVMAKDEHDHFEIVTELVHMIEDEVEDSGTRELYLLASLHHFTNEMEMLREMDAEAELDVGDMPSFASIFARENSKQTNDKPARSSIGSTSIKPQRASQPINAASTPVTTTPKPTQGAMQQQEEVVIMPLQPVPASASAPLTTSVQPHKSRDHQQPQPQQRIQNQQSSTAGEHAHEMEDDLPCSVCFEGDSLEGDPIVICELCSVAVHQTCYRIAFLPEGDWYCHPCSRYLKEQDVEKNVTPTRELLCVVCLTKGGAMVPTNEGAWMHMACSMYLPELYVQRKDDQGEVICGVALVLDAKLTILLCRYCSDKAACAQCAYGKCTVSYHVLCALKNKISFAFIEAQQQFGSGCLTHQSKFLSMDGLNVDSDSDFESASAPTSSPMGEQQRRTPSAKQDKVKQNKQEKKMSKEKKKARASSWKDEGTEKDEHVLISSDSEDDESPRSVHAKGDVQFLNGQENEQRPNSNRNRQLKPESGVLPLDGTGAKLTKKSRQSTLSFGYAKPSIVTGGSGAPPIAPRSTAVTPSTVSVINSGKTTDRLVLQSRVFVPAFYPPGLLNGDGDQEFEYVMILIPSQPIGMVIATTPAPHGTSILLDGVKTENSIVVEALRKGVIQDGDEVFAMNHLVLRNLSFEDVYKHIPNLQTPIQCWFRTQRCRNPPAIAPPTRFATNKHKFEATEEAQADVSTTERQTTVTLLFGDASSSTRAKDPMAGKSKQLGGDDGLSVDWPWFFLRSDGKIAMNLFWRSLDGAFFLSKINKRVLLDLQNTIENMVGVRFSRDHSEYAQVQDLLVMPKRDYLPPYLVEFRKSRKQKKKFLSSDIFMGVSAETLNNEDEVDEQIPIEVGTIVTVAKRTWAGINKLGGAGRVKKVHEITAEDGKKRFTYDIGYVLGGGEKKVERKYISKVNLDKETETKEESTSSTEAAETGINTDGDDGDSGSIKMRLSFQVDRSSEETLLDALSALAVTQSQAPPTRRTFEFQISTENGNVHMQRKAVADDSQPAAKDLLLHKHFEVKLSDEDAIVKASFQPMLLSAEERTSDDLDDLEDDEESENDEVDEIKSQLEALQQQFGAVLTRNQEIFASIKSKIEEEYATKTYRKRYLENIQRKHYEQMYREIVAANEQFEDSDEENESDSDVPGTPRSLKRVKVKEPVSDDEDEENEDDSFGGLFVNKIKQEGDEICFLCELSGGDFAATSCGHVVHPQCAMYTPETYFKDGVCHGIADIPSGRRSLSCSICQTRKGLSKIQCASKRCVLAYHISCAYINGLLIRDPHYQAWCPKHMKSSGMAHEVELPMHLQKAAEHAEAGKTVAMRGIANKQKKRATHGKKGRRETPRAEKAEHPGAISSSKTDKKRKRKSAVRNEFMDVDNEEGEDKLDENGRSCVRRLDINEDSEGDACVKCESVASQDVAPWDPTIVFKEKDVVMVLAREWVGSNKPGGVARIRAVHKVVSDMTGKEELFYDVAYVLTSTKDKRVEAQYVRTYDGSVKEKSGTSALGSRKKSRSSLAGHQ